MTREKKKAKPLPDTMTNRMRRAHSVFAAGASSALGVKPVKLTPRKVTAALRVRPMHLNRSNVVNGGIIMAFADVLGAAGAVLNRPLERRGGTQERETHGARGRCRRARFVGHGERIWATSNADGGATVHFTVPANPMGHA